MQPPTQVTRHPERDAPLAEHIDAMIGNYSTYLATRRRLLQLQGWVWRLLTEDER